MESTKRDEEIERLKHEGYIIAMRLIQSNIVLDDSERAAIDAFVTKEQIRKEVSGVDELSQYGKYFRDVSK